MRALRSVFGLVLLCLLAVACGGPSAAPFTFGRGTFGAPCLRTEDCASGLCVQVAPGHAVCTQACVSEASCPSAGNWGCVAPREITTSICACRQTASVEICGDGLDNDCDGRIDDCRMCNGVPVSESDPSNCGACGHSCRADETCALGACSCPPLLPTDCAGRCVDTATDGENCGACGNACGAGRSCEAGSCTCSDPASPDYCEAAGCVDLKTDREHCGACGTACDAGQVCQGGRCACPDATKPDSCGTAGCVSLSDDEQNCGSCGNACDPGKQCVAGSCACPATGPTYCAGECVSTDTDARHCGACGAACPATQSCVAGQCGCTGTGLSACGTTCVDLASDVTSCGACGAACAAGETCTAGHCGCASALHCGGACVGVDDPSHCGACDNVCSASQRCQSGSCVCTGYGLTPCGQACVDVTTDAANCGACQKACGASQICDAGTCQDVVCQASHRFCSNGNVYVCGATGTSASAQQTCAPSEHCVEASGDASCVPDVCAQGQPACNGTRATVCNADGSGFQAGGTDCASLTAQACDAGVCKPVVCAPLSETCVAQKARHCNDKGTSFTEQPCAASEFCLVSGVAYCATDVCDQGKPVCDGNVATSCAADGSAFTGARVDCGSDACRGGRCWGWQAPHQLETLSKIGGPPFGAMDPTGNATIVWAQAPASGTQQIMASRFDAKAGSWSAAVSVDGGAGSGIGDVVADSQGNVEVVWTQGASPVTLYGNTYDVKAGTWGTPRAVESATGDVVSVKLTVDSNDGVWALWSQGAKPWVNRASAKTGIWGTPAMLTPIKSGPYQRLGLAADGAGNVVAAWTTTSGSAESTRYDAATQKWGATQTVADGSTLLLYMSLAVRADGRALAVWQQSLALGYGTYAPSSQAWSSGVNSTGPTRAVVTARGNSAFLAVELFGGRASWFDPATGTWSGWVYPVTVPGGVNNAAAAIDGLGGAMLIGGDSSNRVDASRYDATSASWSPSVAINPLGRYVPDGPLVLGDATGNFVAAWRELDAADITVGHITANVYTSHL